MDTQKILARIEGRISDLKTSAQAVSLKAGMSADGIRNWQRRIKRGESAASMNLASLDKVARALNMQLDELTGDPLDHSTTAPASTSGMAEDATPFAPAPSDAGAPDSRAALALFYPGHAAITHRATNHLPELGIAPGDLIVCDLSRLAEPGNVAIVTVQNDDTASATTWLRRYAPPWLLTGNPTGALMRVSDPGVTVRHPVVGVIKMLTST